MPRTKTADKLKAEACRGHTGPTVASGVIWSDWTADVSI